MDLNPGTLQSVLVSVIDKRLLSPTGSAVDNPQVYRSARTSSLRKTTNSSPTQQEKN